MNDGFSFDSRLIAGSHKGSLYVNYSVASRACSVVYICITTPWFTNCSGFTWFIDGSLVVSSKNLNLILNLNLKLGSSRFRTYYYSSRRIHRWDRHRRRTASEIENESSPMSHHNVRTHTLARPSRCICICIHYVYYTLYMNTVCIRAKFHISSGSAL